MRLIVHMGLHKTGSTYLQHLFNDHHAALVQRGVHYQRQRGYPAHHDCAWALARGDGRLLAAMIAEAREAQCETVLVSSEELEAALYDPVSARTIEAVAAAEGVDAVEWHMVIREPGATFASICGYIHHHDYADSLDLFYRAMARGGLHFLGCTHGPLPPFAFNCLDHARFIGAFAGATPHPVIVHDFDERDPYPGWRIAERLGVLDALVTMPGDSARNARKSENEIALAYVRRVLEVVPDRSERVLLLPAMEDGLRANLNGTAIYAEIVSRRYRDSYREALARYGAGSAGRKAA